MNSSVYLVAGLGRTGMSIASWLKASDAPFILFDSRETLVNLEQIKETFPMVDIYLQAIPQTLYPALKAVIASPGIDLNHSVLQTAQERGIPIYGDIECLVQAIQAPIIAITGTNGKSTVTTLVGEMAKVEGLHVAVAGNIGTPVLDLLQKAANYDLWVLELSSFQLDLTMSLSATAASILNISPDHLDRHQTMAAYIGAKQRIYHNAQSIVYNRADENTYPFTPIDSMQHFALTETADPHGWGLLITDEDTYLSHGGLPFLNVELLGMKGRHNWENALAASALAYAHGISMWAIQTVLTTFTGLAHRCQTVRTFKDVQWINDSKGTNIGATCSAIEGVGLACQGKIVLIAGGLGKGADFSLLKPSVQEFVRCIVLIGAAALEIAKAVDGLVPVFFAASLKEAVQVAAHNAKPQDAVLLSPACASQDMFKDYADRGLQFVEEVNAL